MVSELSIKLNNIHLYGFHGVDAMENKIGNEFIVTLSVHLPSRSGIDISDDLADSISYADLYELVKQEFALPSKLIEHVAGRILSKIVDRWPNTSSATIEITKITPPISGIEGSASVVLSINNDCN